MQLPVLLNGNPHLSLMTEGCAHAGKSTKLRGNFKANPWWMLKNKTGVEMWRCVSKSFCLHSNVIKKNVLSTNSEEDLPTTWVRHWQSLWCHWEAPHDPFLHPFLTDPKLHGSNALWDPCACQDKNKRINKKVLLPNGLGQYGCLSMLYALHCKGWKSYVQIHRELDP